MLPNVITQLSDLISFTEQISASPWLALDTEFVRESTYYPELCLIQIATENISACIDVLSIDHIDPLLAVLKQTSQVKIFHSCRQDIEVFFSTYQIIPQPIFDTQIAASILGLDEQISYAELVENTCSIALSKSQSRTDWSRRPLTQAQISYALDDVNHLGVLYHELGKALQNKNRLHWLDEECQQLIASENYFVMPELAWKFVKGAGRLNAKQFYYLRELASWREVTAQQKNLPRRWLLPDTTMVELCQLKDPSSASINAYLKDNAAKSLRHSVSIADTLQQPIAAEQIDHLAIPEDSRLSKEQRDLIKLLMQTTRDKAMQLETSSSLLANRKSLINLILGRPSKVSSGWRKELIGDELFALVQSHIN